MFKSPPPILADSYGVTAREGLCVRGKTSSETLSARVVGEQDEQALEWLRDRAIHICHCLSASLLRHRPRLRPRATMSSANYDRLGDAEAGEGEGLRDAPQVPG